MAISSDFELAISIDEVDVDASQYCMIGNKESPTKVGDMYYSNDGVSVECAITPSDTKRDFTLKIAAGKHQMLSMVNQQAPNAVYSDSVVVCPRVLSDYAKIAGCMPSYDVYKNISVSPKANLVNYRTIGGHLHIDLDDRSISSVKRFTRILDLVVGLRLTFMNEEGLHQEKRRRALYGKAGEIRLKPYGLEYRTLSSWWVANDHSGLVWDFNSTMLFIV